MKDLNDKKILLVVIFFCIIIFIDVVRVVGAEMTVVSVEPAFLEVPELGQLFTIDINISDVSDLFAYEFQLFYKRDVINAVSAVRPLGHFLEPVLNPDNYLEFRWEIKNDFNSTHGRIWLAYTLLAPETGKSGSGVLVRLTFNGTNPGMTPLILADDRGETGQILLVCVRYLDSDPDVIPIPNTARDGAVNVIPEFSVGMVILFFIAVSFTVVIACMTKKRDFHSDCG